MAQFTSKKFDKLSIKDGEKYVVGDVPTASQFNAIVEGLMYATEKSESAGEIDPEWEDRLQAVEDALYDLTYEPVVISSFGAGVDGKSTIEIATGSPDTMYVALDWQLNRTPAALTIKDPSGDTEELSRSATGEKGQEINMPTTPKSLSWTLYATGEKGENPTRTASINVYNGVYWGAQYASEIDSYFVQSLSNKELRNTHKSSFKVTAGDGQYIYYCIPKRLGTCNFKIGGFVGGFVSPTTISFTNSLGYTEDYYVYMSAEANLGDLTVEVING